MILDIDVDTAGLKKDVRNWNRRQLSRLKKNVRVMKITDKMVLLKSFRAKIGAEHGITNRVTFTYASHGLYIALGVGRGHNKDNPRKKREWKENSFQNNMDELADIASKYFGDGAVRSTDYTVLNKNKK